MKSSAAFDRLWLPFTYYQDAIDHPPVVIERGSGIYVFDAGGRGYIDAVGSWWVSIFGHNHPDITAAVKAQLDKIEHVLMAGFVSEPALQLAELLGDLLPGPLTKIFFSDDGSTAVEAAMKMALQYHALRGSGRSEFVSLGGGYHGDTLGAVSVGAIPQYHSIFHDRFKKHRSVHSPYCYRCPAEKENSSCKAECMDSLASLLEERHENIAACIFEPMVQAAAGMRIYPAKALKKIFSLCDRHHILTIADEVATGFGRTGRIFACEYADNVPDILCCAKGLTGGYLPMGVTAVKRHMFDEFRGEYGSDRILNHGHSFTGNPLAASAACAAMKLIGRLGIPSSLEKITGSFNAGLERFREYEVVGDIRSIGLIGALEFVKNRNTRESFPPQQRFARAIALKALELGLIIRPLGDVVYFMPPFTISDEQMENMFFLMHRAIKETIHEQPPA